MLDNENNLRLKSGVSLITVLLFMLVATIAATATYKLLTSQGFSSESRMRQQEARQSSLAGIENARTWMTFHANDVGALIKAFVDGGRKPINLDARLRPLQRAGQVYHVWLTGVNTENSTYKLKLLSSGEASKESKWNEVAIFNVDGLYRVLLVEDEAYPELPFKYNYFGGSTHSKGHVKAFSMLINGNLEGTNPVYTDDDLIVTGNVNVTGSSVGAGTNVCVGGNFYAKNGVLGRDFYIEGNASAFTFPTTSEAAGLHNANVTGNVYIGGNLEAPTTGDQKFQKNLTLNGKWSLNLEAHDSRVAGNMCFGDTAYVLLDKKKPPRTFLVGGNIWSQSKYPVRVPNGEDNQDGYDRIVLGNSEESQIYITSAHPISDYVQLRNDRSFVESRDYFRGTSNMLYGIGVQRWDNKTTRPYPDLKPHMKNKNDAYYLYSYTGPGQDVDYIVSNASGWGMVGQTKYASYYVENVPFFANNQNHLLNYNGKPTGSPYCKATHDRWRPECGVTPWFKSLSQNVHRDTSAGRQFQCAESAWAHCDSIWHEPKPGCDGSKYRVDDILVTAYSKFVEYANKGCPKSRVGWWGNGMSDSLNLCYRENTKTPELAQENLYNGYQVVKVRDPGQIKNPKTPLKGKFIIIVENTMGQQNLPPTTPDSYVLLYLEGGQNGDAIQPATNYGSYNYFIYTKHNIKQIMFNNADFSGSVYAAVGTPPDTPSCAKVGNFQSRRMIFNEDLLNDLTASRVICAATATSCGGIGIITSSETDTTGSGSTSGDFDEFYISMAPQLGVRLESQYKSKEAPPQTDGENVTTLNPSFIVLPRVIYLPQDPYGKLADYYNVQALNGSTVKKSDVAVNCSGPGTMSTTSDLYVSGSSLAQGTYTCTATANNLNIPFWVRVGDGTRSMPMITFSEGSSGVMQTTGTRNIELVVPAHSAAINVNFYCPEVDNEGWSYNLATGVTREGTLCKLSLPANSDASTTQTIATVSTSNAVDGALVFQLLPGEGYIPGSPSSAELYLASSAQLERDEAELDELNSFCSENSDCPTNRTNWPNCNTTEEWVQPSGTTFSNKDVNNLWGIMVGNSSPVTLTSVPNEDVQNNCVIIIPQTNNSIAAGAVEASHSYHLRASAKVKARSFSVGFKGNVGTNNNPVIKVSISGAAGSSDVTCSYDEAASTTVDNQKIMRCSVPVFKGDLVTVQLEDHDKEEFSFWKCEGTNCPTTDETVTSIDFGSFTITDNGNELWAVFGEADKHCFFDEFKNSSVECENNVQYCIDKCGNDATSVCTGAEVSGLYSQSKWHLISGVLSQIITGSSGEIHIDKSVIKKKKQTAREPIVVMSTVNAGIVGTLKALINVPRATSSYDNSSVNIKNSGFMLRANTFGNDYFMLNLYENGSGRLEAQLWKGATTLSSILTDDNGNSVSVSRSKMVMVTANVTASGTVEVSAVVGNFYGNSPTKYKCVFSLDDFNNTLADAMHEFVGFSLADPNFKIYGIGWKSGTYNSECHDTYPTVKCSFAAVATDGVIETGKSVTPWVGHSGWFDSKSCTPSYYYYNGADACGSPVNSSASCGDGYTFDESGAGMHGYTQEIQTNNTQEDQTTNTVEDVKTAKAWLACYGLNDNEVAWSATTQDNRAHCGAFWTGKFTECVQHEPLFNGTRSVVSGLEETIVLNSKLNLRAATLHITLDNPRRNEVEIWLVSESDNWGENDHESHSVQMSGSTGMFDVVQEFATGSNGFDPQNVKQIVLKNHGSSDVSVTSITSTCANAIGITYCSAEYDGNSWNVSAQITNKANVSNLQVSATVEGSSHTLSASKNATGDEGILWNGDIAQLSIPDNKVYNTEHQGKHYYFNATITPTGAGSPITKTCSVSPDPIGTIGRECWVIGSIASGAPYPVFNVNFNGCSGSGCAYELYLDEGNNVATTPFATGTETSVRSSATGNPVCNETAGCPYTYRIKSTDGKFEECRASFTVLRNQQDVPPTVTCGLSTNNYGSYNGSFFTTDDVYFWARNSESVGATYAMDLRENGTSIGSGTLNSWSNHSVISLGKLSAATHSYDLFINGEKVCDASAIIRNLGLNCSVSSTTIDKGESVTFRVSWADGMTGQPSDCSMSGSGVPTGGDCYNKWNFNQDITVTPAATGNQNYSYSVKWNNNGVTSDALTCSWTVKVNNAAPTFDCNTNMTAVIGSENNVTIGLKNVTGCSEGGNYCYFEIKDGANSKKTGDSYTTSGNLPSFTDDKPLPGDKKYSVRLTNSVGNTEKECTVSFAASSNCNCTCRTGCDNLNPASRIEGQQASKHCLFATTITEINENYGKHEILVNGQRPGYCSNSDNNNLCSDRLASLEKVDGGYYIETPATSGNDAWLRVTVSGSRTPDCGGVPTFSCPDNLSYPINSSVSITPANLSGCGNGCSYSITNGTATQTSGSGYTSGALGSFTGSSTTGTEDYTVTLTNSVGSASRNCSVTFTGAGGSSMCETTNIRTYNNVTGNLQDTNLGSDAICLKVEKASITGCQYNNFDSGRQIRFNGGSWSEHSDGQQTNINASADADGYIWIDIRAGGYSYSAISCW